MSGRRRAAGALFALALALLVAAPAPPAGAQDRHGDQVRAILAEQQAAAGRINYGSTSQYRLIAGQTQSALSAYALQTISAEPASAGAVMAAIGRHAPEAAGEVARTVAATFPGLSGAIYGGIGLPAPAPAPVAQAFPRAAPPAAPQVQGRFAIAAPAQGGILAPPGDLDAAQAASMAIQQIAQNPALLTRAVQAAMAAAPGRAGEVVERIAGAFPGFATQIRQAASGAPPPQSLAAPGFPAPPGGQTAPRSLTAPATAGGDLALRRPAPQLQTGPQVPAGAGTPRLVQSRPVGESGVPSLVARDNRGGPRFGQMAGRQLPAREIIEGQGVSNEPEIAGGERISDPLEPVNRFFHAVNDTIDVVLLRPIAWVYNRLLPDPVIAAIGRVFDNLGEPVIFANDLLQFDFADAGTAAGRFAINSTIGVLGLFDFADDFGLERHHADFGQTLQSYGTGPGPYLVLPLIGPSTTRDAFGRVVDTLMDPRTYLLDPGPNLALTAGNAVVIRERVLEPLDELKSGSLDYYAALKAAYYQRRAVELRKGLGDPNTGRLDELFDAADDGLERIEDDLEELPSLNNRPPARLPRRLDTPPPPPPARSLPAAPQTAPASPPPPPPPPSVLPRQPAASPAAPGESDDLKLENPDDLKLEDPGSLRLQDDSPLKLQN